MKKGLVIVESPTKVRTIKRYLGKDFDIRASVGHVKDLPKKRLGVNVEDNFKPEYEIISGKNKIIKELKSAASKVDNIYLAPDPDREGEAIAWHIAEELQAKRGKARQFHRVMFHELTEQAIKKAIKSPEKLNKNKYESQQARRILDRLVGYKISPLLWNKVKRGLSAGRVQSVAVRIICDREREIQAFVPEEYWTVAAQLEGSNPPPFLAKVIALKGKKLSIPDGEKAQEVVRDLNSADFRVAKVETKERKKYPSPPFITSTMQQEAASKLRFSAKKTMMMAQRLYEGIDLGDEGPVGLITYMRTDSTRVAKEAVKEARILIDGRFGKDFVPQRAPVYKRGKMAQDAHEAIRPTSVARTPEDVAPYLDKAALALYNLIWKRFIASQMSPAILDQTRVDIEAGMYLLRVVGTIVRFPGFTILYSETKNESQEKGRNSSDKAKTDLPALAKDDPLKLLGIEPKQHFTQPPPRYSEASLIKTLEEEGIGRPSTYANILSTIQGKEYVRLEKRYFYPSALGLVVTDLLVAHFSEILDSKFTAAMEKNLDGVEDGSNSWIKVLEKFYGPFSKSLDLAKEKMKSIKTKGVSTDIMCDKCGAPMVIKYGKSGEFLACSGYPECKNTKDFRRDEKGLIQIQDREIPTDKICDQCGRPMVIKKGRFGEFLACSGYPECRNTKSISTGISCPEPSCDGELFQRRSRSGKTFFGCSRYPKCKYATWDRPVAKKCPLCGFPILVEKNTKSDGKILKCPAKGCKYKIEQEGD
ncbi:MAG: type I DNA topoisomerase [Thermodesulfobacteriota bacterium]|nr:MAG: type I DNA topoisomerase [Thermodesulfobacteriota bacterium]